MNKNEPQSIETTQDAQHALTGKMVAMDEEAWVEFVEKYRLMLIRLGCSKKLSQNDSEDLADEVILRTFVYFREKKFELREGVSIVAWLRKVHQNLMLNLFSHSSRKFRVKSDEQGDMLIRNLVAHSDEGAMTTRLSVLPDSEFSKWVREVASSFPTQVWQAYFRTKLRKLSAEEVADQLGITREDVYNFNRRVKRKLEKMLGDDGNDPMAKEK